ncbi:hypothetical protein HDU83_005470 [Entophlyctis luteolus]|nr:hypothetical protein HDU83_005470 [Entophlyctis luteolus]
MSPADTSDDAASATTSASLPALSSGLAAWETIARFKVVMPATDATTTPTVRQIVFDSTDEVEWSRFVEKVGVYSLVYSQKPSTKACALFGVALSASSRVVAMYTDEDGDTIIVDSTTELRDLLRLPRVPKLVLNVIDSAPPPAPEISEPAPPFTAVEYPPLDDYPEFSDGIAMRDVESVAPTECAPDDAGEGQYTRGRTLIESESNSDSDSLDHEPFDPEAADERAGLNSASNVYIIDMSHIAEMVRRLVDQVTRDPHFMNNAIRSLHEVCFLEIQEFCLIRPNSQLADKTRSQFDDLFRMFNDLLSQQVPPSSTHATHKEGRSRPTTRVSFMPEASSTSASAARTPTIHLCTGITDECRHLHAQPSMTTRQAAAKTQAAVVDASEATARHIGEFVQQVRQTVSNSSSQAAGAAASASGAATSAAAGSVASAAHRARSIIEKAAADITQNLSQSSSSPRPTQGQEQFNGSDRTEANATARLSEAASNVGVTIARAVADIMQEVSQAAGTVGVQASRAADETASVAGAGISELRTQVTGHVRAMGGALRAVASNARLATGARAGVSEAQRTLDAQVDRIMEMGLADGTRRERVAELVGHFEGDLDRVAEMLLLGGVE